MESIHHFSHSKHPLFLKKFGENEEEKEFVCKGCHEQFIEKDNYYACDKCWFYLHKKCADLPREINLPCHQHPLTLFAYPPDYYSNCICDICRRSGWKWFTYHCSLCEFDVDVICSSFLPNTILQHEGHPHPLSLQLRPSLFRCDACNTKDDDLSCFCTTCQFWIHKSCAFAPKSIKVVHHDDPLFLAYSLPEQHLNFDQYCDICKKVVYPSNWVYYCDNCRYFTHLKCATSNPPRLTTGESEIQDEEGDTESSQLMQFPFPNRESDPTSLFVANKNASVAYDDGPTEISHRLHHHPLSIIATKNVAYNDMICDGCVRPISAPFYSCSSKCNFFLHKFCAELPEELLQCPLDSGHSIKVRKNKSCYDPFECSFCERDCNGFLCECVSCDLELDIGCASNLFPSRIKHDSHVQHPLVRSYLTIHEQFNLGCNASSGHYLGRCVYSCKACSFNLCIRCVNYPGSVRHEYDRHSIPLTYPPIKDHPSDFICEICEEDINPRDWMYHCKDCNQSFHADCLSPFVEYSNLKFGGKVNIDKIHTHPLTFVRNIKSENASLCDQCAEDRTGYPILECAPCGFKLCIDCTEEI